MGHNDIIELNGKKYDAVSGAFLGESRIKATPAKRGNSHHQGQVIDGFIRKSPKATHSAHCSTSPAHHTAHSSTKPAAAKLLDVQRPKKTIKPHQPERPKTLMRHVVSKPKAHLKPAIKTTAPSELMAKPVSDIAKPLEKKLSVAQVNPFRLARAKEVAKSHHIRRFSKQQAQPAVIAPIQPQHQSRATHYVSRPVRSDGRAGQAVPQRSTAIAMTQHQSPPQPKPQESQTTDIFEAALAHATSHEQSAPFSVQRRQTVRRKRLVNILAGIGAFLLIGGFVTYMNLTNIEMRVASMRAGFHAQLPSYHPTGYAKDGGIESSDGRVSVNFRSGESLFTITQKSSDWNSQTLLDQTVSERGQPKQTIQSKGRTIYIYDDSNATWVNGGILYQVTGNAALDPSDLVSLATSL